MDVGASFLHFIAPERALLSAVETSAGSTGCRSDIIAVRNLRKMADVARRLHQ